MMINSIALTAFSIFTYLFTLLFSFSYIYLKNTQLSDYSKCFSGGVLLSTIIFHIFPDIYVNNNAFIAPFFSGVSFLILFSIDKLYLSKHHNHYEIKRIECKLQAIIFILALSIHSFLEGLGTSVKNGIGLFWYALGLLGHKWIEAFVVSVTIFTSGFNYLYCILLLVFYSSLTPLGTIMGMFIIEHSEKSSFTTDMLNGFACGSFFYIGFIEMLNSEFHHSVILKKDKQKIIAIFMGFFIMTSLALGLSLAFGND